MHRSTLPLRSLFLLSVFAALTSLVRADFTATYDFGSVSTSSGTTDPSAVPTVTNLTFGSFTATGTPANPNAAGRFSFTDWATGATASNDTYSAHTGSVNTGEYYSVTITPQAGYKLNLTALTFTSQRSGTGIRTYAVRSNAGSDAFATNLPASISPANSNLSVQSGNVFYWAADSVTTAQAGNTVTLTGSAFQNLTSAVTFRFYGWNAEASGGTFSIDNVTFTGSVVAAGGGATAPAVASTSPADGATSVAVGVTPTVTFDQAVTVTGAWFTLSGSNSGAHTATVSGGPTTFTLTPEAAFTAGETVTLTVVAAQVTDQATGTLHPTADYSGSFTTLSSAPLAIHTVQGSGTTSAYANQSVTVQGVVVATFQGAGKIGGYYLEAPVADQDADAATSEGIYVYDNANTVAVGDLVTVTGTVTEYGTAPATETEISPVTSFSKSGTAAVPPATAVTLPFPSTGYAERYEGMLVSFAQTLTVTDTYDYGHYGEVVLSNGRLPSPTNVAAPGAPALAQMAANALNQLILDDGSSTTYPDPTPFLTSSDPATATRRGGSTVAGLTGVFGNKFGAYVVEPTATPAFVDANPRPAAPTLGGSLHVAIGNVLNFFNGNGSGGGFPTSRGADTYAEYQRQRAKIVAGILAIAPDIMGLTELENDGFGATSAIQDLVNGLNAGAPSGTTYAFVNAGGSAVGTDLITCGLIYKANTVQPVGAAAVNTNSLFNRPPIAQTFRQIATGEKLTICINHFKSKGSAPSGSPGSNPDVDQGDGQSAWNATRTSQANALAAWLATNPTGDADPDVLIVGDLNAYAKEDPIVALAAAGYANLTEAAEGVGGYSYAFNAEYGHLDHALANPALAAQVVDAVTWHVNADEPVFYDYNTENKSTAQQAINVGTAYRYSDHDPVVVGLDLLTTRAYAQWAAAKGLGSGNNAGSADPDGDGVANRIEYALGLDPLSAASAALPAGAVEGGQFVFRFVRDKTAAEATCTVQQSADLLNWTPLTTTIETEDATTATLVAALPMTPAKAFVRLNVNGVATVPVGYLKTTLPGSAATTAVGIPLDDTGGPLAGIRAGKVQAVTATSLTNSAAGWTAGALASPAAPWAVRLTTGNAAGRLLDVTANTATTLTIAGASLTTLGVAVGDAFELVPLDTLASLFGALQSGVSAGTADVVQVRSGTTWVPYYRDTNLGCWRRTSGSSANSDNVVVRPDSGVLVTRRGGALALTFLGRVLGTKFRVPVNNASTTVVGVGYPMDTTLSGLAAQTLLPGWRNGTTASTADQLCLFNGSSWTGYFFNGANWQTAAGTNSDAVALAAGTPVLIQRPGSASGATDLIRNQPY